eukprot:2688726-Rhodomonas_salina.1
MGGRERAAVRLKREQSSTRTADRARPPPTSGGSSRCLGDALLALSRLLRYVCIKLYLLLMHIFTRARRLVLNSRRGSARTERSAGRGGARPWP